MAKTQWASGLCLLEHDPCLLLPKATPACDSCHCSKIIAQKPIPDMQHVPLVAQSHTRMWPCGSCCCWIIVAQNSFARHATCDSCCPTYTPSMWHVPVAVKLLPKAHPWHATCASCCPMHTPGMWHVPVVANYCQKAHPWHATGPASFVAYRWRQVPSPPTFDASHCC